MNKFLLLVAALMVTTSLSAQYVEPERKAKPLHPLDSLGYKVEMQGSFSHGKTPLWMNANKYGLSSLDKANGYLRAAVERPLSVDDDRKWGIGYGLDVAAAFNYTSKLIVQQAYAEVRWLHGTLTVGSKEQPMELKSNTLSSGSQTLGKNARPVPQVRLALPKYWTIPLTKGWLHMKGHIAYGRMTDDNWQHDFTNRQSKYAENVLYHSKAGYLMIGNPERFFPVSLELGLEMACTFGGTSYLFDGPNGEMRAIKGGTGIKDFWKAFLPGGAEVIEEGSVYQNAEGNQLGSWLARINYDTEWWRLSAYIDKFFEDHSSMLFLDYDGYGTGENWDVHERRRYFTYKFKDFMVGLEFKKKYNSWLTGFVFEYLYSKYQSGPIYHDHTQGRPDSHICGMDNYYNHYIYTGWQHWGQVIGNPLYRSPIYNDDGTIEVKDNRFMALHLGVEGQPTDKFGYRGLVTYQDGLGTYMKPYYDKPYNLSFLLEGTYNFITRKKWLNGVSVKAAMGADFGSILNGRNYGLQLTIAKSGIF
jgi:hypothetical protein